MLAWKNPMHRRLEVTGKGESFRGLNARGQGGHSEGPQQNTYRLLDAGRTIVRACARRIVEGDIMLPAPPPGEQRMSIAEGIPEEANGWACAGPVRMQS